ncbi:hypothetical protein GW17_00056125 [Ensete ventricosum]|nr:hypothetical protein GW17_00056125 [Ensete ventricosum]
MPPQDRAPVKDADLEMMSMNLKEGGRCVVNRDEDMVAIDFDGDVSLAEKEATVLAEEQMILTGAKFNSLIRSDCHASIRSSSCERRRSETNVNTSARRADMASD